MSRKVVVRFRPSGKQSAVPAGTTLFSAAHWIGLPIESTCGGRGTCGKCKVQVARGEAPVSPADHRELRPDEIEAGWRLSCQAEVESDTDCEVPEMTRRPKAATMGTGRFVLLEPNVHKVFLTLPQPDLEDQRSDLERLRDALDEEGYGLRVGLGMLRELPGALRSAGYAVTAVLVDEELIALEGGDTRGQSYGVAFDVGTTTVVGTLMDLRTGSAREVASALNGQAPFGADVISRISHAMDGGDGIEDLRRAITETMNGVLAELYASSSVTPDRVYEVVAVGNATMLHLLLGIDPTHISMIPFVPVVKEPLVVPAADLGIDVHPGARLQTLPGFGAYVGADILAGVLAAGLARDPGTRLFVDIGTNGEIVLGSGERTLATAAPAGPAFEGGQIRCGMRATDGAIEGVVLSGGSVELQVIGGAPPRGICGSGLVDAVAELRAVGLLDPSGRLRLAEDVPDHPMADRLVDVGDARAFQLAEGVYLTQKDVRELQFAKGSIATGIKVLMDMLGVDVADLDEVLLAGSFGTYINPESARVIGLVPPVAVERIRAVGNAAGEGAKMALVSFRERALAFELPGRVEYVELSGRAEFNDSFVSVLAFPELEAVR